MCQFKSGIILKNKVVVAPIYNDSHSALLNQLGIEDDYENAARKFVRAELVPKNKNRAIDPKEWKYIVDQDVVPDWYSEDPGRYEGELSKTKWVYIILWRDRYLIPHLGRIITTLLHMCEKN